MKMIIENNDETYIATCSHCKSVFTYNKSDVSSYSRFVTCPVCNEYHYHYDETAEKYNPGYKFNVDDFRLRGQ